MSEIRWNPDRQVWETEQADLFSGLPEPFAETWPVSGMTRNGRLLPLPTSVPPIGANGCSSSQLLPTPVTEPDTGNGHARNLGKEIRLLPTPVATDAEGARNATSSRQPGSQHHVGTTLTDVLWQMAGVSDAPSLLPTPRATDATKGGPNQRDSSGDLMLPVASP